MMTPESYRFLATNLVCVFRMIDALIAAHDVENFIVNLSSDRPEVWLQAHASEECVQAAILETDDELMRVSMRRLTPDWRKSNSYSSKPRKREKESMKTAQLFSYITERDKTKDIDGPETENFLETCFDCGIRLFFGVELNDDGILLADHQYPDFFLEYVGRN